MLCLDGYIFSAKQDWNHLSFCTCNSVFATWYSILLRKLISTTILLISFFLRLKLVLNDCVTDFESLYASTEIISYSIISRKPGKGLCSLYEIA